MEENFYVSNSPLFRKRKKKKIAYNKRAQLQLNWNFNMYLITSVT